MLYNMKLSIMEYLNTLDILSAYQVRGRRADERNANVCVNVYFYRYSPLSYGSSDSLEGVMQIDISNRYAQDLEQTADELRAHFNKSIRLPFKEYDSFANVTLDSGDYLYTAEEPLSERSTIEENGRSLHSFRYVVKKY